MLVTVGTLDFANALPLHAGVIRITPEGTVEGTDKISQNGNTYTLTGDINGGVEDGAVYISIERDDVVLDGAGKTVQGTNGGTAIGIYGRSDVTIKNLRIVNFGTGIELYTYSLDSNTIASNNRIIDNYFETKYWAIDLRGVKGLVSGNTFVSKSSIYGVAFSANETSFTDNVFKNGGLTFNKPGVLNTFSDNIINGKPLVVLEGQSNQVIDDANQVILINCKDMVIQNIVCLDLRQPIMLFGTTNTKITDCTTRNVLLQDSHSNTLIGNEFSEIAFMGGYGTASIELTNSHNNIITQNSITGTGCYGMILTSSGYNKIEKNNIVSTGSDGRGISLDSTGCEYNYIFENNITSEAYGIYLQTGAEHNVFFKNNVNNCQDSIMMSGSLFNDFLGNTFSGASRYAVYLGGSDFNNFVWNAFEGNTGIVEAHEMYWMSFINGSYYAEYTQWDNGKEGNYWGDYTGADTDGDGIGEAPYHVYENFTDNYPLTKPYDTNKINVNFKEWVPTATTPTPTPDQQVSPTQTQTEVQPPDSFPVVPVAAVSGTAVALAGVALLWYFKKLPKIRSI
ncbi:MAG: nitrous oxide reductase family maturation protein NosD [Candidatus Bathyarchaeia archaeon]